MFNRIRQRIPLLGTLLLGVSLSTFAEEVPLITLEALVKQWVGLRGQISEEQQNWKQQQLHWQRENELLKKEDQQLDQAIARAAQFEAAKESQTSDKLARHASLQQIQKEIEPILEDKTAELKPLFQRIPETLLSAACTDTLRELNVLNTSMSPARRLQLLTQVLSEIESLQNHCHPTRELIRVGSNQRREMDVVYLGLSRAFAVSPDDSTAAIGISTETGWQWNEDFDITKDVRNLVSILNAKVPPALVTLPMAGHREEGQP